MRQGVEGWMRIRNYMVDVDLIEVVWSRVENWSWDGRVVVVRHWSSRYRHWYSWIVSIGYRDG